MSHSYPSDISREQFDRILPTLESARRRTKPRTVDILYLLKSGCQWRMLPAAGAPARVTIPRGGHARIAPCPTFSQVL